MIEILEIVKGMSMKGPMEMVLLWYIVDSHVNKDDWESWNSWRDVNEGSNGDGIIFKHYKRKINSRQHND